MAILSKVHKSDNSELQNFLKLTFTSIGCIHFYVVASESFLRSNSSDIFASYEINLKDSI